MISGLLVDTCNSNTRETEAGRSPVGHPPGYTTGFRLAYLKTKQMNNQTEKLRD
jgi:hypothetical protein